jgi:hypothetical protein
MSFSFRSLLSPCLIAVLCATQFSVSAQEPSPSLYEKRLGIQKGTSTGIVVYDFEKSPRSTASTPPSAPSEPQPEAKPSREPVPQPSSVSGFWSTAQPPSGRSLMTARRLGALNGGIPVPTVRKASEPKADPVAKQ